MELSRKKQQSQALSQSKLALQRKNANNFYVIKSFSHVLIALDQGMFSTTNIISLDTSSRVYEKFPSIWKKYFAYHVGNYHWMENEDLVKMYERKKSKIFFYTVFANCFARFIVDNRGEYQKSRWNHVCGGS